MPKKAHNIGYRNQGKSSQLFASVPLENDPLQHKSKAIRVMAGFLFSWISPSIYVASVVDVLLELLASDRGDPGLLAGAPLAKALVRLSDALDNMEE